MTCACCGSEIPDQFATEFCDACHDPIKLRALVQQQKNIIALLGQPIPYVTTKTVANAEDLPSFDAEVPEILRVIPKKHYTVEYIAKSKHDAAQAEIESLRAQLAEAKKDSERLDAMIDNHWAIHGSFDAHLRFVVCSEGGYGPAMSKMKASGREAIDAAIAAAKEES